MKPTDRAAMCGLMMGALIESVGAYGPHRGEPWVGGYGTPKNGQANKTAIRRQIVALRQSLLALGEEI